MRTGLIGFSPPLAKSLVAGHDEVILGTVRSEAETNHDHDRSVTGRQITWVKRVWKRCQEPFETIRNECEFRAPFKTDPHHKPADFNLVWT